MAIILYVEDDPDVHKSTQRLLSIGGHTVKGAHHGQQGLEVLAQEDKIDIILSDFKMPVMNGYDFLKVVKTDPKYSRHSKVPVVGVGDFPVDRREYLVKCMPKPYNPEELLSCIDQHCK